MKRLLGLLAILMLVLVGCGAKTDAPAKEPAAVTPPVAQAPAPIEKKWVVTNTWEGNGSKTTENFEVTENTRVNWECDKGYFNITLQDEGGTPQDILVSTDDGGKKDTTYLHEKHGQYSLDVGSSAKWKITVEKQQ
ncbi:hypothetical protein [Desulfosporosinus sp. OT]|uniref:hypothetical protein n=1 Tax=Desulfosporosinus sp. OT TaxID=913865 RepID=UPI000223A372|nr:hypothetical protein [Desulfosporosinus sp. OT]EGW36459.1 putative lipoprotein [Desulfosporosinus sp. OT]